MKRRFPIYLDCNSTTPIDPEVLRAMEPVLSTHFGNPASSTHAFGWYAAELTAIAREEVSDVLGAQPRELVFTGSATESINTVIKGLVWRLIRDGRRPESIHLLSSVTEHRATLDALEALKAFGVRVTLLPVDQEGQISAESLVQAIEPDTALVSLMLANNEIGTLHDIAGFSRTVKTLGRKILFHCDATQALGKMPVDVKTLGVDFLSVSAHKIYGPKGVGALYVGGGPEHLEPLIHGGAQEFGLRSGTANTAGIVGFGKACTRVKLLLSEDVQHLCKLSTQFFEGLQQYLELSLNGPALSRRLPGNLNLGFPGIQNSRLLAELSPKLAFSVSSACSSQTATPSHVLLALGLEQARLHESFRVGFGRFTSQEDVQLATELFVEGVKRLEGR